MNDAVKKLKELCAKVPDMPFKQFPLIFFQYNEKNEQTEQIKIANDLITLGFFVRQNLDEILTATARQAGDISK